MRTVFLPSYTIGVNAYDKIPEICQPYGNKVAIIGGKTALEKALTPLELSLEGTSLKITGSFWYGGNATFENVENLTKIDEIESCDMIFAVGGGRALDTCKYLSKVINKPVFTFPTIASTCAAVTKNSVMYHSSGELSNLEFYDETPEHSFIDTKIIAEAPFKYLWAGMGDTLAKYFESDLSARGDEPDHSNAMGLRLAKLCWIDIERYGKKALDDCKNDNVSAELERIILTIIVTTGLVSCLVTHSKYNSHLAHALYYGLTSIPEVERNHLHGEIVAYGVVIMEYLDENYKNVNALADFYKKVQLPLSFKTLGATDKDIDLITKIACELDDVMHTPYPIIKKDVQDAIDRWEEKISNPSN